PLQQARARPARERRLCRGNRAMGIVQRRPCVQPHYLVGVRRVDVGNAVAADPFAVDEVLVQVFHISGPSGQSSPALARSRIRWLAPYVQGGHSLERRTRLDRDPSAGVEMVTISLALWVKPF